MRAESVLKGKSAQGICVQLPMQTYPFRGRQGMRYRPDLWDLKFPGQREALQAIADCAGLSDWSDPRPCGGDLSSRVLVLMNV